MDERGTELAGVVGHALAERAPAVARRWQERALAAAPRVPPVPAIASADAAEAVVRALAGGLHKDARWHGEVMRLGWAAGAAAHGSGSAAHHVLKEVELLIAIVLAEVEQLLAAPAAVDAARASHAGPADGLAVARRIQRAGALFAESAAAAYLHAFVAALRRRWRVLRHDLRSPLGTIRGALSLMEDEALPVEARTGPKMRDMLARNAGSLERLIGVGLGDEAPRTLLATAEPIPLRELALAVRRAVREPAELVGCEVVVEDALPLARVDAAAAELALTALVLAGLQCAATGDALHVGARADVHHATFTLVARRSRDAASTAADDASTPPWESKAVELAAMLAEDAGGRVRATGDEVRLELPCVEERGEKRDEPRSGRRAERRTDPRDASAVELRDDVRRAD